MVLKGRDSRLVSAKSIIKQHFNVRTLSENDRGWAELVANWVKAWGHFEPQLKYAEKKELNNIIVQLERRKNNKETSSWLRIELKRILEELEKLSKIKPLHGAQNTSNFTYKVSLVEFCREIWTSYTGKEPPLSFRGEAHRFSKFMTDIIYEVLGEDFTARSAIEAYQKSKNTH